MPRAGGRRGNIGNGPNRGASTADVAAAAREHDDDDEADRWKGMLSVASKKTGLGTPRTPRTPRSAVKAAHRDRRAAMRPHELDKVKALTPEQMRRYQTHSKETFTLNMNTAELAAEKFLISDESLEKDFNLLELFMHIIAVVCCLVIGYGLQTNNMYQLARSTPEGLAFYSDFRHTIFDFEDIDTIDKFEEWLGHLILDHYKDPFPENASFVDMEEPAGNKWLGCPKLMRRLNSHGMHMRQGIAISQSRGTVAKGKYKHREDDFGADYFKDGISEVVRNRRMRELQKFERLQHRRLVRKAQRNAWRPPKRRRGRGKRRKQRSTRDDGQRPRRGRDVEDGIQHVNDPTRHRTRPRHLHDVFPHNASTCARPECQFGFHSRAVWRDAPRNRSLGPLKHSFSYRQVLSKSNGAIYGRDNSELGVSYPFGIGYHIGVNPNMTYDEASIFVNELFRSGFFNPTTRMVHVALLYSGGRGDVGWKSAQTAVLFSVELSMTGFLFPHWMFVAWDNDSETVVTAAVAVLGIVYFIQLLNEVYEIVSNLRHGRFGGYLTSLWNYVDWGSMLCYAFFLMRYYYRTPKRIWDQSIDGDCDLMSVAFVEANVWQRVRGSYAWQLAFMLAFTFWRTFKFLQISPALMVAFSAVSHGAAEIIALIIVFIIMSFGFAWIFHCNYSHITEFSNITNTLISLLSILCGSLDPYLLFDGFGKRYEQVGQMTSAFYVLIMDFILLNIFISIITTHYIASIQQYGRSWLDVELIKHLFRRIEHLLCIDNLIEFCQRKLDDKDGDEDDEDRTHPKLSKLDELIYTSGEMLSYLDKIIQTGQDTAAARDTAIRDLEEKIGDIERQVDLIDQAKKKMV